MESPGRLRSIGAGRHRTRKWRSNAMDRHRAAAGLAVAACMAASTAFAEEKDATPSAPQVKPAPVVATETGKVQGRLEGLLRVFKGIPYAAPPVGPLRWKPPMARQP